MSEQFVLSLNQMATAMPQAYIPKFGKKYFHSLEACTDYLMMGQIIAITQALVITLSLLTVDYGCQLISKTGYNKNSAQCVKLLDFVLLYGIPPTPRGRQNSHHHSAICSICSLIVCMCITYRRVAQEKRRVVAFQKGHTILFIAHVCPFQYRFREP